MTIRNRLLMLLLPPLTALLILNSLFFYYQGSKEILLAGSCIVLLLLIGTVFASAERISKPVRQLNRAALAIAAGNYEADIQVEGPKEVKELAQTLNTMNQCLIEHMSRIKESSLIRERMYGEYECSLLLQHYMLQKVIEEFSNPCVSLRLISVPQSPIQKGLLLTTTPSSSSELKLTLSESSDKGFDGLFLLNQQAHRLKKEEGGIRFIDCHFFDHYRRLRYDRHELFPPLVWSIKEQSFIKDKEQEIQLENLDLVFLYNSSVIDHFETEGAVKEWLARVLRHFAEDGLESIQVMLTNELSFLIKKQHIKHSFKIIGLQINLK